MKLLIMSDRTELKKCNNQIQHEEKARNGKPLSNAGKVEKRGKVAVGLGLCSDWFNI